MIDCEPINEEEEDNEKSVLTYLSAIENKMIQIIHAYGLAYITSVQADIIAIGTDKTQQGRGFGRVVLQHMIAVAEQQNVAEITLEVAADNLPARHLYETCGFKVSGVRKNYYHHGENRCDALIMVRRCDSAFP